MTAKISVITPSFNSIHTIGATIASVAGQDHSNREHIVVDGGSTDGTIDLLKASPGVRWISEKDEGHYHAMDKGIRMADGEVFAILNADDCYRPGALSAVAAGFAKHPDWDGLFGDLVFVDGDGQEIMRREEALFDRQAIRFGQGGMVNHQTLFLKREVYLQLGAFRYKEFKNCCDYEYLMRLIRARKRIGHIPTLVVNYRYHQFGQSADMRIRANMGEESARIRSEYGVPGGALGRLLYAYGRVRRQMGKLLLRGKCDVIPGSWLLKRHLRQRASFSSNIGLDKL
jgi:glycosyltransferase involved in cell wall biosynthesis